MKKKPAKKRPPDPAELGQQLATYLKLRWDRLPKQAQDAIDVSIYDDNPAYVVLRLKWERDFWREKALNP